MSLQFTKMHGLGNDFIVFDGVNQTIDLTPEQIAFLGDRHTGIGFDQMLVIAPATSPDHDFSYLVYNSDGGQVENCGNGSRCIVSFIREKGLSEETEFTFRLITGGLLTCRLEDDGNVTVNMGTPILSPAKVPFRASAQAVTYPLTLINGEAIEVSVLSMGNPFAVLTVPDVDRAPVLEWGPLIEHHEDFPNRVNACFMQVINAGTIRLRVFERGAGETLACGTGACAAVAAGILQGVLDNTVQVQLPRGKLQIHWQGDDSPLMMTGPSAKVFEGTIDL